jgi:hypothetical protein
MTTRGFQLMAMAGAEGAKEASGAMDDSKESTNAIKNLVNAFLRVQTRKKNKLFPYMMNKVPQMSTLKPS